MATCSVDLHHGLARDGGRQTTVTLRALTGADELAAFEEALPAARTTRLLGATMVDLDVAAARTLTLGDRARLLLSLNALSFGAEQDALLTCAACGETAELTLDLATTLPVPADPPPETGTITGTITAETPAGCLTIQYKVPNGHDLERAAAEAARQPASAGATLLQACVLSITGPDGAPFADALRWVEEPVADAIRAADPAAETMLHAACPHCGAALCCYLDAQSLLEGRIGRYDAVLGDVHRLARGYHWHEADILALPVARRRRYLSLLDAA